MSDPIPATPAHRHQVLATMMRIFDVRLIGAFFRWQSSRTLRQDMQRAAAL